MRNSPLSAVFDPLDISSSSDLIAPSSPWRIHLIGAGFSLIMILVVARLAYVQTQLTDRYLAALQVTTTETEILPARDGRILAGGVVFAADIEQYAVQLHYRWLQANADSAWLRQQIRNRLSRKERSNAELVAGTEQQIQRERDLLRKNLTDLLQISDNELRERCARIETRVQRIADSVNRRHQGKPDKDAATVETDTESTQSPLSWPMRIAAQIRQALTTPPKREADQRIIVREEESWHTIVDDVALSIASQISEHPEQFPGARITSFTRRTYPQQNLAAHVVGAQTAVRDDELVEDELLSSFRREALHGQRRGRFGVELSYAKELKGVFGVREIVRNRRQQVVSSNIIRTPVSGHDVVLTIDPDLQQTCEHLLAEVLTDTPRRLLSAVDDQATDEGRQTEAEPSSSGIQPVPTGGSIVVMDVQTGQLLAAASAPGFDLNLFAGASDEDWQRANADQRRPFISRFSGMALPPGSTFKTLTAVAALETGAFTAKQTFFCQGYLDNPDEHRCLIFRHFGQGHGNISLTAAMAQSCNVYFFDAARRMGILPIAEWAERFEFGQVTGVDLPFEKSGTVPVDAGTMSSSSSQTALRRFQREALGFAIGQSKLTVTPLQISRLMASIANGGWLVTPHVVSEEGLARRTEQSPAAVRLFPRRQIPGLTVDTLSAVRRGLTAVCEESYGTGYKTVRLPHVQIAGKTGTAETSPGKPDHAWFAGYAPADDPQIAFVVVLEHGGSGSHAAGPVAREVVRKLFPDSRSHGSLIR